MDEILRTLDKLGLPPDDPIGDIMDQRFLEERAGEGKDATSATLQPIRGACCLDVVVITASISTS